MALGLSGLLASVRATTVLWLVTLAAFLTFRIHDSSGKTGAIMDDHAGLVLRLVSMYLAGVVIYKTEIWKERSASLIGLAAALFIIGMSHPVIAELSVATVGGYLLFIIGFTPLRHAEARRMPDVSYGVYLYGWPVQKLLILWWPGGASIGIFVLSFIGSVALGFASWVAIEKPALALERSAWRREAARM